tara:strand:+ start:1338 stop:2177 length:840 start_codon:yes stop_codon:yes gene_type:complete
METQITNQASANYRQSTDVAGICKQIVVATAQRIGKSKYVKVEGWQAIATAHGCVASARDVERLETGFRAIGEVRRMDTGTVISTAEGFLGDDEEMWSSRPEYARRAMAQTRAISRACRSAFAHVVVLIGEGLSTTPAEEVPLGGFDDAPRIKAAPPVSHPPKIAQAREVAQQVATVIESKTNAPESGDYRTLTIERKFIAEGESARGPWQRWDVYFKETEGRASTFDKELGAMIDAAGAEGTIEVSMKSTERGTNITDIRPGGQPAPAAEVADDDIPF